MAMRLLEGNGTSRPSLYSTWGRKPGPTPERVGAALPWMVARSLLRSRIDCVIDCVELAQATS